MKGIGRRRKTWTKGKNKEKKDRKRTITKEEKKEKKEIKQKKEIWEKMKRKPKAYFELVFSPWRLFILYLKKQWLELSKSWINDVRRQRVPFCLWEMASEMMVSPFRMVRWLFTAKSIHDQSIDHKKLVIWIHIFVRTTERESKVVRRYDTTFNGTLFFKTRS